ncbi:MAG: hypothetical protein ACLQOO_37010 [Terriglobia bacterium]
MRHRPLSLTFVFLFATAVGTAQEGKQLPVSRPTQSECSGFIAAAPLPKDVYVLDGADDDFHERIRQFTTGDLIYLRGDVGGIAEGTEFRLVRPEKVGALPFFLHLSGTDENIIPPMSWAPGQRRLIRKSGHPYDDAGRVRVIRKTPEAAVAQITFSCGPILRGDIAVLYQPRPIPEYVAGVPFDRFAAPNQKLQGTIIGSPRNDSDLAQGDLAYINRGSSDGVEAGQVYRVVHADRERPLFLYQGLLHFPATPQESVGEVVILFVEQKSAVAVVVASTREIAIGDAVQLE